MENNFIEMAAPAGHAVAYTIDPIFKHISIVCSCISPIASPILSFVNLRQLSMICGRNTYL